MAKIPHIHKNIAKVIANAFGVEKPPISRYWDDNHENFVNILESVNSPQNGVTSFATIGLSDHPLILNGKEFDARLEIVGACGSNFKNFDNVLSTAAFCVINSQWFCAPGVIFPDVLSMYDLSPTMSDLYFVPPFLWEENLRTITFEGKKIAWLLAVPISKAESAFAQEKGPEKLEDLFEKEQIDIYDLHRPSVV